MANKPKKQHDLRGTELIDIAKDFGEGSGGANWQRSAAEFVRHFVDLGPHFQERRHPRTEETMKTVLFILAMALTSCSTESIGYAVAGVVMAVPLEIQEQRTDYANRHKEVRR